MNILSMNLVEVDIFSIPYNMESHMYMITFDNIETMNEIPLWNYMYTIADLYSTKLVDVGGGKFVILSHKQLYQFNHLNSKSKMSKVPQLSFDHESLNLISKRGELLNIIDIGGKIEYLKF